MSNSVFTIQISGADLDSGHVRLSDFLRQIEALRVILKQLEEREAYRGVDVYYRIVDLHHSAATLKVEQVIRPSTKRASTVSIPSVPKMFDLMKAIPASKPNSPPVHDLELLEAIRAFTKPLKSHVTKIVMRQGRRSVTINERFVNKLGEAIGADEMSYGSIAGRLEAVNFHNTNRFVIWPAIGPKRVSCHFADDGLRLAVKGALGQIVTAHGHTRTKRWSQFPHSIDVKDLEIHPDDSGLPSLLDLADMAPGCTGGLLAEEFLESSRDDETD